MNCIFRPTGEINARGLPKLRCSRAGCANVCFTQHQPAKIHFRCRHPALFQLGEFTAAAIKTVTLGIVREKPGCGCKKRRERLNKMVSVPVPNALYRCLLSIGKMFGFTQSPQKDATKTPSVGRDGGPSSSDKIKQRGASAAT